jgi:hypothetical protein
MRNNSIGYSNDIPNNLLFLVILSCVHNYCHYLKYFSSYWFGTYTHIHITLHYVWYAVILCQLKYKKVVSVAY